MTREALADLLLAAGIADVVGWITDNIAGALLLAAAEIDSWEGEEWAVEFGEADEPVEWAAPDAARVPFGWLRGSGASGSHLVSIYQDDADFGLDFVPTWEPGPPPEGSGVFRRQQAVPAATGKVVAVEVVLDTLVEGRSTPGLVSEAIIHGATESTLLIAADAYAHDEWHLYDESVVMVRNPAEADSLRWLPTRIPWTSTIRRDYPAVDEPPA